MVKEITLGILYSGQLETQLVKSAKKIGGIKTIILTDDQNKVVDVFSVAQDSSDNNAQNDLTVEGFDFSAAGPGFPTTSDLNVANVNLSSYSWTKTNLAPASSRNSYVITVASEGSYQSIGGTTGTTGNPKWTLSNIPSGISGVKVVRAGGHLPGKENVGDPQSTFRLEARLNPNGADILRVGFKLFMVDEPETFLPSAANFLGITYEEINVWLFVVIWPLLSLVLFAEVIRLRIKKDH